jgi:hypothetical protein
MLAVANTVPMRIIGCLPQCGRKDEHMLIFQEWDDGVVTYLGQGGARAFKRALHKYGRKDNLITGYHNRVLTRTGATLLLQYWVDGVPENGYFGRVKKFELLHSIRAIKRG